MRARLLQTEWIKVDPVGLYFAKTCISSFVRT